MWTALMILAGVFACCATRASEPAAEPASNAQLLAQLRSADAAARDAAACKIAEMGPAGAFAVRPLVDMLDDERRFYAGDISGHDVYSVPAEQAAEALLQIGPAAIAPLITRARDSRPKVRARVIYVLAQLDDDRAIAPVARALTDRSSDVRLTAAIWMSHQDNDERFIEPLIKGLKDRNDQVRWRMSQAIVAYADDPRVQVAMKDALAHGNEDVQSAVLDGLARLDDPEITALIVDVLNDDARSDFVRSSAAHALGNKADEKSFDALIRALDSPAWYARSSAIQAVGKRRDSRAVPRLMAALESDNMTERMLAAESLGSIGDARAVSSLENLRDDPQTAVREKAAKALQQIESRSER
jgi:HEAT repeat protein